MGTLTACGKVCEISKSRMKREHVSIGIALDFSQPTGKESAWTRLLPTPTGQGPGLFEWGVYFHNFVKVYPPKRELN